jgi:hypothetical protein
MYCYAPFSDGTTESQGDQGIPKIAALKTLVPFPRSTMWTKPPGTWV